MGAPAPGAPMLPTPLTMDYVPGWHSSHRAPNPEGHGWTVDKNYTLRLPVTTTISVASKARSELVKSGCRKDVNQGVHIRRQN